MIESDPLLYCNDNTGLFKILLQPPCNGRACLAGYKTVEFAFFKMVAGHNGCLNNYIKIKDGFKYQKIIFVKCEQGFINIISLIFKVLETQCRTLFFVKVLGWDIFAPLKIILNFVGVGRTLVHQIFIQQIFWSVLSNSIIFFAVAIFIYVLFIIEKKEKEVYKAT